MCSIEHLTFKECKLLEYMFLEKIVSTYTCETTRAILDELLLTVAILRHQSDKRVGCFKVSW